MKEVRRENRKHVAAMMGNKSKSFYARGDMAQHEAAHVKYRGLASRNGEQTNECVPTCCCRCQRCCCCDYY